MTGADIWHDPLALAAARERTGSAAGPVASFRTDLAAPLRDLTVGISPVQSGSGDPSPENVRPISGWTGANIVVSPTLEAADGTTYPISWQTEAGTVYGGTLDVTTGVLTGTHRFLELDGVTNGKKYDYLGYQGANYRVASLTTTDGVILTPDTYLTVAQLNEGGYLCSCAKGNRTAAVNYDVFVIHSYSENGRIQLRIRFISIPDSSATLGAYNRKVNELYAAGTPVQYVYPLQNPVTYQLTPVEVQTLLGRNNIWSDTGDVALTWREGGIGSRSWMLALLAGRRDA